MNRGLVGLFVFKCGEGREEIRIKMLHPHSSRLFRVIHIAIVLRTTNRFYAYGHVHVSNVPIPAHMYNVRIPISVHV